MAGVVRISQLPVLTSVGESDAVVINSRESGALATYQVPVSTLANTFTDVARTVEQPFAGAVARTLQSKTLEIISAGDFGVSAAAADNTVALQAFLDACAGSGSRGFGRAGHLPAGNYFTGPLYIRKPLMLYGDGSHCTALNLLTGAAGAALNISCAHDGTDYSGNFGDPTIVLSGFQITGNKGDATGIANGCDGISLTNAVTNFIRPQVRLHDVNIMGMPRYGIKGAVGWVGVVEAIACRIYNCGVDLLWANSSNDWQFTNVQFGVAGQDAVLLSGCGQFIFTACNFYSATRYNLNLFNGRQNFFKGCSFDRAQQHGVFYNVSGSTAVVFESCYWNLNGRSAVDTYSDVYITSAVTRGPSFVACDFQETYDALPLTCFTKSNIEFQGGSAFALIGGGTSFGNIDRQSLSVATVTNTPAKLQTDEIAIRSNAQSGATIYADTQYSGLSVRNRSDVPFATLKGHLPGNVGGVLELYDASGNLTVQLGAVDALAAPALLNNNVVLGDTEFATSPTARALNAQSGSGTDVAGADLSLAGGRGTGTGVGGSVRIRTSRAGASGATSNSLTDALVANAQSGAAIYASNQYAGITLMSADGTVVAQIKGQNASNKGGVLQLFNVAGAVGAQIVSEPSGDFPTGTCLFFPGPYADDAAAAAAGVAVGYTYRKTGGTVAWRVS